MEKEITFRLQNPIDGIFINFGDQFLKSLEQERTKILLETEEQWHQRSRAIWLHSGDQNTKFFHNYASFRRNSKFLWELKDEEGQTHSGQENLKKSSFHHFKDFYKDRTGPPVRDQVKVVTLFKEMLNNLEAEALYRPFDLKELQKVLSKFKVDKSPGLDGWTVEFFKDFFDIVGEDLLEMVEESRQKGFISGALNSTFITLIPKTNKPHLFRDFHPISLCNLCYKIISKVIVDCIKPFLSRSLSEE